MVFTLQSLYWFLDFAGNLRSLPPAYSPIGTVGTGRRCSHTEGWSGQTELGHYMSQAEGQGMQNLVLTSNRQKVRKGSRGREWSEYVLGQNLINTVGIHLLIH